MRRLKKWAALICAGMMAVSLLAGCGRGGSDAPVGEDLKEEKNNNVAAEEEKTGKSMGRYLEREVTVPEEMSEMGQYLSPFMRRLESGDLMLAEKNAGKYISTDNGETWEYAGCPWSGITKDVYITDIAISPTGGVAMVGFPKGQSENEVTADITYQYYYVDAQGQETELELPDDIILWRFGFDNAGRLYGYANGGKVYRFDPETGSKKELFAADGTVDFACFTDKYMVGVTILGSIAVYDMEQDVTLGTDEVLGDFIKESLGLSIGSSDAGHSVVMTAGEKEDIIYFAFKGGLYRHVIGGAAIEQIIDGGVSTFGDPSVMPIDMIRLPDNEFMTLYTGMKLYRYTYDPDVPTVPEKQLKIYSLQESIALRQAVSMYQKNHEDIYIRYEIGMSGENSVTREDAVRNLNTKIMSGEGPDILLLDGLPQASYEAKGVLADISAVVESMSGDAALFPNIVEACRKDGKVYALPVRVQIPMVLGRAEDMQKVKDITSLADVAEELREENPEGGLLDVKTPEQLLYILRYGCSAAWTDEKGNIDEKALEEFLTAATRIWQAHVSGVDEDDIGASESGYGSIYSDFVQYYGNVGSSAESVAMGISRLAVGKITDIDFDYDLVTTLKEEGYDIVVKSFDGQVKNGFASGGMAGITANAADNETAIDFYRYLFGKEQQDMNVYNGLPVNMASFEELKDNPRAEMAEDADKRSAGGIAVSTPDGGLFDIDLMWPTEEEFRKLEDMVTSASAISTGDAAIESTVFEIGPRAMEGSITPHEAVQEIVRKSAIYLAE